MKNEENLYKYQNRLITDSKHWNLTDFNQRFTNLQRYISNFVIGIFEG